MVPQEALIEEKFLSLSERQLHVAYLVACGYSNKAIASELNLSEQVVKNILHSVFDKLGVWNRVELANRFRNRGSETNLGENQRRIETQRLADRNSRQIVDSKMEETCQGVTSVSNPCDPGMDLHDLLMDAQFLQRRNPASRANRRFEALRLLSHVFAEAPQLVLQKLVDLAVAFCGADSAGISLEEADGKGKLRFRWVAISGSFAQYVNGTTPRFFSPCGTCLSSGRPQHYRVTQRYYDFLGVVAEPINDGLLIPWRSEERRGTIWAVSHGSPDTFVPDDYGLLSALADFAGISVRVAERDQRTMSDLRALQRIQTVTTQLVGSHDLYSGLAGILCSAADICGTGKGSIQLYDCDTGSFRTVAYQGFEPSFLAEFLSQGPRILCDLVVQKVERVIWENVAEEPILSETDDLDAMMREGIRAIHSTPLISHDGRLLGLLNNHFNIPHRPSESELRYLDLLARMAADFIERWQKSDRARN